MTKETNKTKSRTDEIKKRAKAAAKAAILTPPVGLSESFEEEAGEDPIFSFTAPNNRHSSQDLDLDEPNVPEESSLNDVVENWQLLDHQTRDIFVDVGEKMMNINDMPKYTIMKNHFHMATVNHPFSWDLVQKQYGGGFFKVIVRSAASGRIATYDTRNIEQPANWKHPGEIVNEKQEPSPTGSMNPVELMGMMSQMQGRADDKAAQNTNQMMTILATALSSLAPKQTGMEQLLSTMVEANKKSGSDSQIMTLMMEMNKQNASMIEKMNESNIRMFEKMNERIEKLADSKPKENSLLEMVKLFKELTPKDDGFDKFKKIFDIAKELADEKMENSSGEEKSESLTDSIIKSMLPALATRAMAAPAAAPAQPQQQYVPQTQTQTQTQPQQARPVQRPVPATQPITAQQPRQAVVRGPQGPQTPVRPVNPSPVQPVAAKPVKSSTIRIGNEEVDKKEAIGQVAYTIVMDSFQKKTEPLACAKAVLVSLSQLKLGLEDVKTLFTWGDIEKVVKEFDLSAEVKDYLRAFYDSLEKAHGELLAANVPANRKPQDLNGAHGADVVPEVPATGTEPTPLN